MANENLKSKATNLLKKYKESFCPQKLFFSILIFFVVLSFFLVLLTNIKMTHRGFDIFMDFFNHIRYSRNLSKTYFFIHHACFPAFAYLFYQAIGSFFPKELLVLNGGTDASYHSILLFTIFNIIIFLGLCYCIVKTLQSNKADGNIFKSFGLTALLLLSSVFIFTLERGNSTPYVLILLLLAVYFKDSDSKIKREIALILIAIATGFKIYPAVFGFLYFKEKRYREIIKLIIYGAIFFFVPFIFVGGFDGFVQFLKNQITVQTAEYDPAPGVSIYKGLSNITVICKLVFGKNVSMIVPFILIIAFLYSSLYIVCFSNQKLWKKLALLSMIMIIVPSWSGGYTSVYLVLPLVYFLKDLYERKEYRKLDWIYAVLFAFIFLFFEFDIIDTYDILGNTFTEVIRYFSMYSILALILFESFFVLREEKNVMK